MKNLENLDKRDVGPDQPLIRVDNLCKEYRLGKEIIPVLRQVTMEVAPGGYVAIVGPSGSGKSTFLNILGCLDVPTSGTYFLKGEPVHARNLNDLALVRNQSIGFVFQNFNLLPRLSVEQNVELPLLYASIPRKRRQDMVRAMLETLGLWDRRKHRPHEISGGQKQRVALARALVKQPDFILADEPTGNLDSDTTAEILKLFHGLHQAGNAIVLITHEQEVARQAEAVYQIKDGRLARL